MEAEGEVILRFHRFIYLISYIKYYMYFKLNVTCYGKILSNSLRVSSSFPGFFIYWTLTNYESMLFHKDKSEWYLNYPLTFKISLFHSQAAIIKEEFMT